MSASVVPLPLFGGALLNFSAAAAEQPSAKLAKACDESETAVGGVNSGICSHSPASLWRPRSHLVSFNALVTWPEPPAAPAAAAVTGFPALSAALEAKQ